MTFLEAVQALKDGQCKGITRRCMFGMAVLNQKSNEFGNCHSIVWDNSGQLSHLSTIHVSNYLATDWELVDLIPQTETVEVKHFAIYRDNHHVHTQSTREQAESYIRMASAYAGTMTIVELVGTYERPVKAKVKHRQEVSRAYVHLFPENIPDSARFFAEWEA